MNASDPMSRTERRWWRLAIVSLVFSALAALAWAVATELNRPQLPDERMCDASAGDQARGKSC